MSEDQSPTTSKAIDVCVDAAPKICQKEQMQWAACLSVLHVQGLSTDLSRQAAVQFLFQHNLAMRHQAPEQPQAQCRASCTIA
jgi:hypothetical protein